MGFALETDADAMTDRKLRHRAIAGTLSAAIGCFARSRWCCAA
jgi:hypothetical protein